MKIDRVEIRNFRSIKSVDVDFNPSCRVLVGINESGKSNILKALALLGDQSNPIKKDDLRDALRDEDPISEAFVRFVFKFEKSESDELIETVFSQIASSSKDCEIISNEKNLTLAELCAEPNRNEGLYVADILSEKKSFKYWSFDKKNKLIAGWKKPTAACPADFTIEVGGENHQLSNYKLVRVADFANIPQEYLGDADFEDLASLIGGIVIDITKKNLPKVIFWEYDEKNLLPSSVKISDFAGAPDTCAPLKNMFALAGIEDIKTSIDDKLKGSSNQIQNYLDVIAGKTTDHFKSVWKEYKNVEFSLRLNADQIIPGVKEKNTHDFSRRSDGFKRFITFLLMISVNVKTDHIKNTLLLIDEPDASLHPSGARYLRDELIKISQKNYVVYSTHSIFMIDPGEISRHYIVKKKDEITSIESAGESNIADEEVLYNALGFSVFSILKEYNIIFEGWNDKRLFQIALEGSTAAIKKKFKDVSFCHAKGVRSIKTITPLIELANRKCLIISDSDQAAKNEEKVFREDKVWGDWKNYQEIDPAIEAITGEDFIENKFIAKQVKTALSGMATMPEFSETILPDKKEKIAAILKWLMDNGMSLEQAKSAVTDIKHLIFENLEKKNIEGTYAKLLEGITLN